LKIIILTLASYNHSGNNYLKANEKLIIKKSIIEIIRTPTFMAFLSKGIKILLYIISLQPKPL